MKLGGEKVKYMYGINEVLLNYERNDYSEHVSKSSYKVDCSFGTNPYGRWPQLKILEGLLDHVDLYPHDDSVLLEGICRYFKSIADIMPENIELTCGSIGAVMAVNRMFLRHSKKVIGIAPQFPAVVDDFNIYGSDYEPVHLKKEHNYQFVLKDFLKVLNDTENTYIYIDNPNNPTGQIIPKTEIEEIIKQARVKNSFVVVDEAYGDYMDTEDSAVSLLDKYDNFAIIRTFSKGLGAAGIRLGYVIGSEDFIYLLGKVNTPFANNSISTYIASQIINSGWNGDCRIKINDSKKRILTELSSLKIAFTSVNVPISMLYCENRKVDLCKLMEKTGLKVVSCQGYEGLGINSVRLNLNKNMDMLMKCLKETEQLLGTEYAYS
jgi:histidinol-phosphate aminotransferase